MVHIVLYAAEAIIALVVLDLVARLYPASSAAAAPFYARRRPYSTVIILMN